MTFTITLWSTVNHEGENGVLKINRQVILQGMVFAFPLPLHPSAACGCAAGMVTPAWTVGLTALSVGLVVCQVPRGTRSQVFVMGFCSPSLHGIAAPLCAGARTQMPGQLWLLPAQVGPGCG